MDNYSLILLFFIILVMVLIQLRLKQTPRIRSEYLTALKNKIEFLDPRIKDLEIYEGGTSFILDKKMIVLCTRDADGNPYSENTLMYVLLHEIAHALSEKYDDNHKTEEFNTKFYMLRKQAVEAGLLHPDEKLPDVYCNIRIPKEAQEVF